MLRRRDVDPSGLGQGENGSGHRMGAVGFESRGSGQDFFFGMIIHGENSLDRRAAVGEGPGLVKGNPLEVSRSFKISPALDQDAVAGRGGEPGHDADRSRNHQRTWAGDHQDDQGLIEPGAPCPSPKGAADHGHKQGEQDHGRSVYSGEAIHPLLDGRAPGLGFLDHMDDPGQRGVGGWSGRAEFQGGLAVDGARVYFIIDPF